MPTDYDVGAVIERIENELIDSMMRNLKLHLKEEEDMGFDWMMWQVEQLKYLEEYRKKNAAKYGKQFRNINLRLKHVLEHGRTYGQKEEEMRILQALKEYPELRRIFKQSGYTRIQGGNFFKINESKLNALIEATTHDMEKAEYAVLRRCNDQYRKIIFDAQMYANTGAGTVKKAVDMATHDFLMRGIDCIEYANGARHTLSDYADMAIRTAERRAYLMGAGEMRKKWGISLVIVNRRGTMTNGNYGTACPKCIPWLGKILVDDVYSDGRPDGKHQLLSTAIQQGFLHPRCRDSFTTYFPGVSKEEDPVTKAELQKGAEQERQEARQNYVGLQAEKFGRLAKYSLDPENRRKYEVRKEKWVVEADKYHDKAAASADPMVRMVFERRERQIREASRNQELRKAFSRARYKDGAPVKRFVDITRTWFKDAVPKSHPVVKLQKYVKDGKTYVVDGFHVVMKPSPNEIRVANLLREKIGGEICIVPKVNYPERVGTPDYLFNGIGYDLKTITGCGNSTLRDAVKRKRGQSTRFIFDLSNSTLTDADVERQMHGMFGNPQTNFVKEIVVIRGNNIEKVYRRT